MNLDVPKKQVKVSRSPYLAQKIVVIDGLPGCAKTLFFSLISAFAPFEKLTYSRYFWNTNYIKCRPGPFQIIIKNIGH